MLSFRTNRLRTVSDASIDLRCQVGPDGDERSLANDVGVELVGRQAGLDGDGRERRGMLWRGMLRRWMMMLGGCHERQADFDCMKT